jgi:hypothetical protein
MPRRSGRADSVAFGESFSGWEKSGDKRRRGDRSHRGAKTRARRPRYEDDLGWDGDEARPDRRFTTLDEDDDLLDGEAFDGDWEEADDWEDGAREDTDWPAVDDR